MEEYKSKDEGIFRKCEYEDNKYTREVWIDPIDWSGEKVNVKEENRGIARITSRHSDEESGHVSAQITVNFKRFGYRSGTFQRTIWG